MTDPAGRADRRVERAIRWTPAADRARYAEEWRHDLAAARADGDPAGVARAARRMAVDLRLRWWARVFLGDAGTSRGLRAWGGLLVLAVAAFLLGGPLVILLAGGLLLGVVALARAGTPNHWSHWLVVASLVLGAGSGAFFWWSLGVAIDAADDFTPVPAAATWGGAGLLVFLGSGVTLVAGALVAVRRERQVAGATPGGAGVRDGQ